MVILVENHRIIPLPEYLCPSSEEGVPLELGTGAGDQKCEWWGNRAEKKFDNNFHLRDSWMDRQMDKRTQDGSKDCAYA